MRSALPDDQSKSHEVRFLPDAVVSGLFHFYVSSALILLVIRTFLFSARAIRTIDVASAGGDSADC
jgi:hypothetical protein